MPYGTSSMPCTKATSGLVHGCLDACLGAVVMQPVICHTYSLVDTLCRARGIDPDAARQVLVYSFGAEVTQHLKHKQLIERVQKVVASTLSKAPLLPVDSK